MKELFRLLQLRGITGTKSLVDAKRENKFPFWLGLGIVYEHFHSAKTIQGATTMKLVPEQYVEIKGKFAHFLDDPHIDEVIEREPLTEELDVVIVGSGPAGSRRR